MLKVVIVGYDTMLAALIGGTMIANHQIVGILRSDRVKYSKSTLFFKDIFAQSKDKSFISSYNLHDIKANSVNSKEFKKAVKDLGADIILVGSWMEKFDNEILNIPRLGVINCHPSLLPKHRGANPYFWSIYENDAQTGVTFHLMSEKLDAGKILMQGSFDIEQNMTGGKLREKAAKVAEVMLIDLLSDLEKGCIVPAEQDETQATYDEYPYDGIDMVDFNDDAIKVYNQVRGLHPWGMCRCNINGKVYKIKSCKLIDDTEGEPNSVLSYSKGIFKIKCKTGVVEIDVY